MTNMSAAEDGPWPLAPTSAVRAWKQKQARPQLYRHHLSVRAWSPHHYYRQPIPLLHNYYRYHLSVRAWNKHGPHHYYRQPIPLLHNYYRYHLSVRARNKHGAGAASTAGVEFFIEPMLPLAVGEPRVICCEPYAAEIAWDEP